MSQQDNKTGEIAEKKIVITPEECKEVQDFWKHFKVDMPQQLKTAFDAFIADPSIVNQDAVKLEICKAISESQHEAFKDEMFKKITEECSNTAYLMQFDKDLEDTVTVASEAAPTATEEKPKTE